MPRFLCIFHALSFELNFFVRRFPLRRCYTTCLSNQSEVEIRLDVLLKNEKI